MKMWAIDFVRAFYERPFLFRIIALLCMGRYARRELQGIVQNKDFYDFDYGLEHIEYHKGLIRVWDLAKLAGVGYD